MKIAIVGAGGTGGYFGALLARAGHDVGLICRKGAHLDALRSAGLRLKSTRTDEFTVRVVATDDPSEVGAAEMVLFAVKAYDSEAALAQLGPLVGPATVLVPLQNGLDSAALLARTFPVQTVGALVYVVSEIASPGCVTQTAGPGQLVFGELSGAATARCRELCDVLFSAGIAAQVAPDIRVAMWQKFAFICAYSGVIAVTRTSIGAVMGDPDTRQLFRGVMQEVVDVAASQGVHIAAGFVEERVEFATRLEPWGKSSMYFDLEAGRRLELDALHGSVVRMGRAAQIPTPLCFSLYAALKPHARGKPG